VKAYVTATLFIMTYLVCSCLLPGTLFGIRINVSKSVPHTIFISEPTTSIHRGQYVAIYHPKSSLLLVKKIIGLPGDSIEVRDNRLIVNNQEHGLVLKQSKSGHTLTPIQQQQVHENHLFAYAPHEESFDSRYQEFGLVRIEHVKEVLCPIF